MGRHRRSAAGEHDAPEVRPGAVSHRRKGKVAAPVRTGLLGISAAVAMGAVAVASGLVPGSDNYSLGGGSGSDKVRSASSPTEVNAQGGTDGAADRSPSSPSRSTDRSEAPAPSPSKSSAKPTEKPSEKPSEKAPESKAPEKEKKTPAPTRTATQKPKPPAASSPSASTESAAEAEVLTLVNKERAKVGCSPVRADTGLASLAASFSSDMAGRDFFDHTDPDGATPWDRAEKAGIADLGGENIARGQANAQSVMDAWMNSPGHRANILNCDYKTLGVGAHFAPGGPWWTQDFGF
ncbi:CAP domain-containing protein [Actinomycetota bacterium Odt1-20B]